MDKKIQEIIFYVLVAVVVLIVAAYLWAQVSDTSGGGQTGQIERRAVRLA